jgi:endoglucanase
VNIAGFDFGCKPFVGCDPFAPDGNGANVSIATAGTGAEQMKHFVSKGLNTFRLPVAWEYLADSPDVLNEERFKVYDQLVQGCLGSGASLCIVDL